MIVETRADVQLLAARRVKGRARFAAYLIQGFQAIRREPGHGDENAPGAAAGQGAKGVLGVGFEPPLAAKERLKGLRPLVAPPTEALDQAARGAFDMRGIRVAA